jgi:two-component system nitrate/nitrite response regulator NarP
MTRLLLVDDHPIILSGVEDLLRHTDFRPVGRVTNGLEVDAALAELDPDILVLDLHLPGRSGMEVLRAVRGRGDRRKIVFLTADIEDRALLEAWKLGLDGLVLKYEAPDMLIACLEEVARGGRWVESAMIDRAVANRAAAIRSDGFTQFSAREREIVDLALTGARNEEIARTLGITTGTVKVHLHRIYEKLGVGSRADLVIYARDRGK